MKLKELKIFFEIGEIVFLLTDDDQKKRIITSYTVYPNEIVYTLSQGTTTSNHYAIEITKGKNYNFN